METVRIVTPTGLEVAADGDGVAVVPRPGELRGRRIGLLDNGKPNAGASLQAVGQALAARHQADVEEISKTVSSRPCPDELLVRFRNFDAAVVGVGD